MESGITKDELPTPLAVDARTAARMLSISPRTLWNLSNTGAVPVVRVGRRVLFQVRDLHEFLAARAVREGGK